LQDLGDEVGFLVKACFLLDPSSKGSLKYISQVSVTA